jgi:hypothetical protein
LAPFGQAVSEEKIFLKYQKSDGDKNDQHRKI